MSEIQPEQKPVVLDEKPTKIPSKSVSKTTFFYSLVLVMLVAFIAGTRSDQLIAAVAPVFGVKTTAESLDLSAVQTTFRQLKTNFDGTLDTQALIDGASRGLVAAAGDRYTVFMDKKETQDFEKELSGEVSGIGAEIGVRSGEPTILRVINDAPAQKIGLEAGDTLIAVNGESMQGATADTAAQKIRGDEGTSVKVTIKRGQEVKDFTITRAKISDPSVRSRVQDGVGIMTISRFDSDTGGLARKAAQDFVSQGVYGVIVDLRDNGGGYLDAARDVSSIWLKSQLVVTEKTGGKVTQSYQSDADPVLAGVKTIVLVNGGSASASEIVSGALQDHKVATLLGEKTFGKGTVQKLIPFANGTQLKVTVARWYTPNGKNITKEGITPDTIVQLTAADTDAGKDPQLDAALGQLSQK